MRARLPLAAAFAVALAAGALPAAAAEAPSPPAQKWSFDGPFGTFDRAALRRGLIVYKDVCAACHSLNLMHYRDLGGPAAPGLRSGGNGGLWYDADQVKALAAQVQVQDGPNDSGDMFERPGRPSDRFRAPYANPQLARVANGGALPPDLSLIVEARKNGADYLYALLTGYRDAPPPGMKNPDGTPFRMLEGMNFNAWFPGHQIAMKPPLEADRVTYADGTKATVDQMARDVVTFLAFAAEPNMEERKRFGLKVILFLIVLTGLLYAIKRRVWRGVH
jgi:ubiquinol-cytochrome c reductase cytochrome c1 subunit